MAKDEKTAKSDKDEKTAKSDYEFAQLAEMMGESAHQWQQSWSDWLGTGARIGRDQTAGNADEAGTPAVRFDPEKVLDAQAELWRDFQSLWLNTTARLMGQEAPAVIVPESGDHRFRDAEWNDNPLFDFFKQSYLLHSRWLCRTLADVEGLDERGVQGLEFMGRQIVDALAPTNFAHTNPAVLREARDTKGESLMRGMRNLAEDLRDSPEILRPKQTDLEAFEVGVNIAMSEGAVVFQTPIMQLIQYAPTTERVYAKPILIVPPWINKFYILDLRPDNSFIRWATDRGYTVFVISWVNPDARHAKLGFDDYVTGSILAALDAIERATGEKQVTAIGFCIGGTLLAATLAYMAANGDDRISAATFFASQVDFTDAGELRVFTDEVQIGNLEQQVEAVGYLDGARMASTFNALRANDLIWHFVVNNYLLGKEPPAFDLLYWNADSTRFPGRLLIDYLRNMYQQNNLARPGGFELLGQPLDLGDIKIPVYIQASKMDHISPPVSVYKMMSLLGGPKRFVLAGSGHIAGVINPPKKNKYQHWLIEGSKCYTDLDSWFDAAIEHPGSWWPDWDCWLSRKSGKKIPARVPGDGGLKAIEPAPGSYVVGKVSHQPVEAVDVLGSREDTT
jgi:polyhydroxyalkanoate synthase